MMAWMKGLRRRTRVALVALGLVAGAGLAGGAWGVYDIHVRHRLGTVTEGVVYKSGTMPPAKMAEVAKELRL